MAKAKGAKANWESRANDVLAGRAKPDAFEILDLIHEVNPTGRGRHEKENAARYMQKARLQSLLIERFADSLTVHVDPDEEGVVSIRHRSGRRDGCHAVIDALDDGARSWVRRQIDLGVGDDDETDRTEGARRYEDESDDEDDDALDDPALLRAAGARAQETFDYERAERLYRRALDRGRDTASALALLQFLVDAIAADADALAVYRDLPTDVRANPLARSLAGLAAARQGDETRALDLAAHAEDPRAADALTLIAKNAIARGDDDTAARALRDAAVADAAHPDLRKLEDEVRKLRTAARASEEEWLGELIAEGRDDEARAKAAAILEQFPESEPARRAATDLETKRRANDGRRLVEEAEAAQAKLETTLALSLVGRALLEPLRPEDRKRAEALSKALADETRAKDAALAADRVAGWLTGPDDARGLSAYVELDDSMRARVRENVSRPELEWIELLGPARSSTRAKTVVEATLALKRAAQLEGKDPAGLVAVLTPHERTLESVPLAKRLLDGARARRSEDRRRAALNELESAERALASGDRDMAAAILTSVERDVAPPDRERFDRLRSEIARLETDARLLKRFERAERTKQYRDVELLARELASRSEEPDRSKWQTKADGVAEHARREVELRIHDIEGGSELSRGFYLEIYADSTPVTIDLEAGRFWLANGGERLFVRAFDIATKRLVRAYELVPPARSDEPHLQISGDSLLILGGGWGTIEIDRKSGDPIRWVALSDPDNTEIRASTMFRAAPGDRHIWYTNGERYTYVLDIDGDRPLRDLGYESEAVMLVGALPHRVAVTKGPGLSIHEPSGHRLIRTNLPGAVRLVAPLPDDTGYFALFERFPETSMKSGFAFGEISADGELLRSTTQDDIGGYPLATVASSRETGMIFVRTRNAADKQWLRAFRRDGGPEGAMREAYAMPLGDRRALAQDENGRRAYLVCLTDPGVELIELGADPPVLDGPETTHLFKLPLDSSLFCIEPASREAMKIFLEHFKWNRGDVVRQRAAELRAEREGNRDALVVLAWALIHGSGAASAEEIARSLAEQHPADKGIEHLLWASLAGQRKWKQLAEVLEAVDATTLDTRTQQHLYHLQAAALLGSGDVAGAHLAVQETFSLAGSCKTEHLRDWIAAVAEPSGVDANGDVPLTLSSQRQLIALIDAADRALSKGDNAKVLALFERTLPWELVEVQSFARLAEAHLATPARTGAESLRKVITLEKYLSAMYDDRVGIRAEVLLPNGTWADDRLEDIEKRARAWIAGPRD